MRNFAESFYTWYKATMRHPKYRWFLIGGTLIYLISPLDISPDFIPVIGWIDDAAISALLAAEISQIFVEYLNRKNGSVESQAEAPTNIDAVAVDVE